VDHSFLLGGKYTILCSRCVDFLRVTQLYHAVGIFEGRWWYWIKEAQKVIIPVSFAHVSASPRGVPLMVVKGVRPQCVLHLNWTNIFTRSLCFFNQWEVHEATLFHRKDFDLRGKFSIHPRQYISDTRFSSSRHATVLLFVPRAHRFLLLSRSQGHQNFFHFFS